MKITDKQLNNIIKEAINELGDTKEWQYRINAVRGRAAARPRYQNSKYNSVPERQKQDNIVSMASDAAWKGRQMSKENPAELDRYAQAGYNAGYQKGMVTEAKLNAIIKESIRKAINESVTKFINDAVYVVFDGTSHYPVFGCDVQDEINDNDVEVVKGPYRHWDDAERVTDDLNAECMDTYRY